MDGTIIIGCIAALLVLVGALIGSELQVRLQEGQRRRIAKQIRRLDAAKRARSTARR